ncbi:hypothetical protein [Sphingomonas sp.]|nr:hypothetical protein [Sphingomonas sp.]
MSYVPLDRFLQPSRRVAILPRTRTGNWTDAPAYRLRVAFRSR